MKNVFKLIGVIALIAAFGFSIVACDNDAGGGVLPAPMGLNAWAVSTTEISLSWNAVPGAAGYRVYWSRSSSSGYQLLDSGNALTARAWDGTPDTTYHFKVAAYAMNGTEGVAATTSAKTLGGGTPPPPSGNPPAWVTGTVVPLTNSVWVNGNLPSTTSVDWYSFPVSAGTTYYVWWNEQTYNETAPLGDGTKTAHPVVGARQSNGTFHFGSVYSSSFSDIHATGHWDYPNEFTATESGTVYLRVIPFNKLASYTGTYGIVYSTSNSRPVTSGGTPPPPPPSGSHPAWVTTETLSPLTNGVWANGSVPASYVRKDWYWFTVTAGTTYYVWWNDRWEGDNTKNGDIVVAARHANGTFYFGNIDNDFNDRGVDAGWNTPRPFTPAESGTVYLRVQTHLFGGTGGTYGIVYSTSNSRPGSGGTPPPPPGGSGSWKLVTNSTFNGTSKTNFVNAIAYGNGKFVAGSDSGEIAYSSDGITWTAAANPFSRKNYSIMSIAWGNNKFVAWNYDSEVAYSPDGITWTLGGKYNVEISGIAWGKDKFVAVDRAHSGGLTMYSSDGITWTEGYKGYFTDNVYLHDIAWGNGTFVMIGEKTIARSSDGINWTFVKEDSTFSNILSIAWCNDRFIAGYVDGRMAYSGNGTSWTTVTNSTFTAAETGISYDPSIYGIAWGNGTFVAVGDANRMASSTNGTSWTKVTSPFDSGSIVKSIAFGNNTFVAGGSYGRIAYWQQ